LCDTWNLIVRRSKEQDWSANVGYGGRPHHPKEQLDSSRRIVPDAAGVSNLFSRAYPVVIDL
jgi:hypothetical protein